MPHLTACLHPTRLHAVLPGDQQAAVQRLLLGLLQGPACEAVSPESTGSVLGPEQGPAQGLGGRHHGDVLPSQGAHKGG